MELLSSGEADIAFVGADKLGEWQADGRIRGASVIDTVPLNCRFVLAGQRKAARDIPTQLGKGDLLTVATSYPKLLAQFALKQGLNLAVTYTPEGGSEGFAASGKTDLVFDITQSGDTLTDNDLLIYREGDRLSLEVLDGVEYVGPGEADTLEFGQEQIALTYFQRIWQSRQPEAATDSYTTRLLRDPNKLYKKLGEEFAEVMQALLRTPASPDEILSESADLLCVLGLLLAKNGVRFGDVLKEDIRRNQSGSMPETELPVEPNISSPVLPAQAEIEPPETKYRQPLPRYIECDEDEDDSFGGGYAH